MIELKALNPHWLESVEDSDYDLCVHSQVWLKIGDKIVSNNESGDWTISASAYQFLKSVKENHYSNEDEQLLPCCGFNFYKVENKFFFGNCGTGINWNILHNNDKIVHQFNDGEKIEVDFDEWRNAILKFSQDVFSFMRNLLPESLVVLKMRKTLHIS